MAGGKTGGGRTGGERKDGGKTAGGKMVGVKMGKEKIFGAWLLIPALQKDQCSSRCRDLCLRPGVARCFHNGLTQRMHISFCAAVMKKE